MTAAGAVEAVWRIESARIIAGLARLVSDVGLAEELAQDTLVIALEQWPVDGVPDNPGAWLMATAKHRAIDLVRRQRRVPAEARGDRPRPGAAARPAEIDAAIDELDDYVGDDLLRLIFTACHPVLSTESRVALTLRLLGGLTTDEIARALLVPEPTVAQRIIRAKRTLAAKRIPFELPPPAEIGQRLASVLEVVYLIFNEGYSATAGDDWMRPALCEEAMRLGRVLAGLLPDEPEVHGLVALMELQASRLPARTGPDGAPILLQDQDRAAVGPAADPARAGRAGPGRAAGRPGRTRCRPPSRPATPGARTAEDTDWERIATLYAVLAHVSPSPVVELNRAVAVGMAHGAEPALAIVDALVADRALADYPQLPGRPRRPAGQARPRRRGAGGVRAGRGADPQRPRAGPVPAAGRGLCGRGPGGQPGGAAGGRLTAW